MALAEWWIITLKAGENKIELQDLTGFDGRCDAVFLTSDMNMLLPDSGNELADFRRNMSEEPIIPEDGGEYDLVVVGGGIAGCCAAISAAPPWMQGGFDSKSSGFGWK